MHYKEIMQSIPPEELSKIGEAVGVDYKVSKLKGEEIFNVLLYSVLEKNDISLRTIEENYRILFNDKTRHSSIASRLSNIATDYFANILALLKERCMKDKQEKRLMIIDSTTLQLSSKLLEFGVKCRETKAGQKRLIKCVVASDGECAKLLKVCTEGSSDSSLFREVILSSGKGSICIFDRGLQKRESFKDFDKADIKFITRGNSNIRYKIERESSKVENQVCGKLKLIEDVIVKLCKKGSRPLDFTLRLIKAENIETGESLTFLTNIYEATAEEISALYKKRWSIEAFFKFIKQELNMKHFLGRSKNTITVMLYMALIAAILLLEYKKCSKQPSYKFARRGFMHELKLEILKPIIRFCGGDPEKIYDYQDIS